MGITRKEWTEEEDKKLASLYPQFGCDYCCEKLGRTNGSIRRRVIRLGLKFRDTPLKYTIEQFAPVVQASRSYSDVTRKMGLSTGHGNRKTIIRYIRKYGLNISHFDAGYERKRKEENSRLALEHILIDNSTYANMQQLKKKLFKYGLKNNTCEECGQGEEWRGKHISLHLDHVNGDNKDNRLLNLRILCPNCHAATGTYANKKRV